MRNIFNAHVCVCCVGYYCKQSLFGCSCFYIQHSIFAFFVILNIQVYYDIQHKSFSSHIIFDAIAIGLQK